MFGVGVRGSYSIGDVLVRHVHSVHARLVAGILHRLGVVVITSELHEFGWRYLTCLIRPYLCYALFIAPNHHN